MAPYSFMARRCLSSISMLGALSLILYLLRFYTLREYHLRARNQLTFSSTSLPFFPLHLSLLSVIVRMMVKNTVRHRADLL